MLGQLVHFLEGLQQTLLDHHILGLLAFVGIIFVAQLFMLPLSPLGMAAGFFFGFGMGWLALWLGCSIGAGVNFLIARHFARERFAHWLNNHEKFRLIDDAIGREGWRIVILLRFVPIPFGLANYCYGLTPVRFWPYLMATCIAIIPPNSLFVWMGSTFHGTLNDLLTGKGQPAHWSKYVLLGVGILAAIIALRHLAKVAGASVARGAKSP